MFHLFHSLPIVTSDKQFQQWDKLILRLFWAGAGAASNIKFGWGEDSRFLDFKLYVYLLNS